MSTYHAQMTNAAWDAACSYDIDDEARRNPVLAAIVEREESRREEKEQEADDGE